jgi:hypothetical protein
MTISPNGLPAASGAEPVVLAFSSLPPATYQLAASGDIGVLWNREILPTRLTSSTKLEFTVPAASRLPGIAEFVLWDKILQQPMPFRGWISVIIPTAAAINPPQPACSRRLSGSLPDSHARRPHDHL